MAENRQEHRKPGYAKVILNDIPGYLRNLTAEGFKAVTLHPLPHTENEPVSLQILPDETSDLGRITLTAELCWKSKNDSSYEYGFRILKFSAPGNLEIYGKLVSIHERA